jgi:hypothetical protein
VKRSGDALSVIIPDSLVRVRLLAPLAPLIILNSGQNYWDHRDESRPSRRMIRSSS